ncbi:MAG: tetratricopeptide repeat protein, partial [Micromonosporaceae bacterium]|nr:tetratricopeptide repeat protein [Micromonosporaceae bacterium]
MASRSADRPRGGTSTRSSRLTATSPPALARRRVGGGFSRTQLLAGVFAGGDICQVGEVHGDVTFVVDREVYRAGPWPPPARLDNVVARPSWLLAADNEVVPFDERRRKPVLDVLTAWRDAPRVDGGGGEAMWPGLSVRLLHGPGGQGKTRLAAQFARASAGWLAVQARHGTQRGRVGRVAGGGLDADAAAFRGLLVVVDYAERWPAEDLLTLVGDLRGSAAPVRLLLLSRPAGHWWQGLAHELGEQGADVGAVPLPPLAEESVDRSRVFAAAAAAFAEHLPVEDPAAIRAPANLATDAYRQVLSVHMAALAEVYHRHLADGRARPEGGPHRLAAYLLGRERDAWAAAHTNSRVEVRPKQMARIVYTAALAGPLRPDPAVAVLKRVGLAATLSDAEGLIDAHASFYLPGGEASVLRPLSPDRLAEDFLALQTPALPDAGAYYPPPDPWAYNGAEPDWWAATRVAALLCPAAEPAEPGSKTPDTPDRCPRCRGADATQQRPQVASARQAITMLVETARRWPHIAAGHLYPLLRDHPQLALAAGSAAVTALARLDPEDDSDTGIIAVLEAIEPHLPDRHIDLDIGSAEITERLAEHRLQRTDNPAEIAAIHSTRALRLANAGRRGDALTFSQRAVDLREELADGNREAYLPNLAMSVNNHAVRLAEAGRRGDALTFSQRAVDTYEELADSNREAYLPNLAMSVNNHAVRLAEAGRRGDALTFSQRAVDT